MKCTLQSRGVGAIPPPRGEGPTLTAVAPRESKQEDSPDCRGTGHARQALHESEAKAAQYLSRLHSERAEPDKAALILSMLCGVTLRGLCPAIVGVPHE